MVAGVVVRTTRLQLGNRYARTTTKPKPYQPPRPRRCTASLAGPVAVGRLAAVHAGQNAFAEDVVPHRLQELVLGRPAVQREGGVEGVELEQVAVLRPGGRGRAAVAEPAETVLALSDGAVHAHCRGYTSAELAAVGRNVP